MLNTTLISHNVLFFFRKQEPIQEPQLKFVLITMHLCKNTFGLLTWENAGSFSRGFIVSSNFCFLTVPPLNCKLLKYTRLHKEKKRKGRKLRVNKNERLPGKTDDVLSSFCYYNSVLKGTNKLPGVRGFVLQQQKQSHSANRSFFFFFFFCGFANLD